MRNPFKPRSPEAFFWRHAGYSYDPKTETAAAGRHRCAKGLAEAERRLSDAGYSFAWSHDNETQQSFRELARGESPYLLWICVCRNPSGEIVGTLGGVDFGPDVEPWSQPYRRVVEAEIADEIVTLGA